MPLTPAQKTTLKNAIAANTNTIPAGQPWSGIYVGLAINTLPNSPDANTAIAGWYSLDASPAFVMWRKSVSIGEVGSAFVATELAGLTSTNNQRLQTIAQYSAGFLDASRSDTRASFDDIFSGAGGAGTRAALLALWKQNGSNAEKLFATGTGSDSSPAVSAFADGFNLTASDVQISRDQG